MFAFDSSYVSLFIMICVYLWVLKYGERDQIQEVMEARVSVTAKKDEWKGKITLLEGMPSEVLKS